MPLKAKVDKLCTELSGLLARQPLSVPPPQSQGGHGDVSLFMGGMEGINSSGAGWPADLGAPSSTGAPNHRRYAIFPATHRLAININGQITLYDTLDHQISGVGQQQAADASLTFNSPYGLVRVADLPIVTYSAREHEPADPAPPVVNAPSNAPTPVQPEPAAVWQESLPPGAPDEGAIFAKIEGLAMLHQKGILTDNEFTSKKAELLSRL
jgi:hypothetical protein